MRRYNEKVIDRKPLAEGVLPAAPSGQSLALVAAMRLPALTEEAKLYQAVAPLREASFDTLWHLVHVRHMTARSVVMKLGSGGRTPSQRALVLRHLCCECR